jgi:hypothetical protein
MSIVMESTAGRSDQPHPSAAPDYDVCWPPGAGVACVDLWSPAGAGLERIGLELGEIADREPLLVDLGHASPIEADCVRRLAGALARGRSGRLAMVCPRREERVALQAIGVERLAPVFASRGDALQARAHYLAGFGPGWLPELPRGGNARRPLRPHPAPWSGSRRSG